MVNKLVFLFLLLVTLLLTTITTRFHENSESIINNKTNNCSLKVHSWLYQLQNASPDEIAKSGFDLVVMDYSRDGSEEGEYSKYEIQKIKNAGVIPIAYLSIGEAESYRFYWKDEWFSNPPEWIGEENPEWKENYAVKYWYSDWKNIIHEYLDKIIDQGFSGVYLDKIDEFEYWADKGMDEREAANKMIDLILDIANYTKNKTNSCFYIILQNGEGILKYDNGTLLNVISGFTAEDLFYDRIDKWNKTEEEWIENNRLKYLDIALKNGKIVLSVDYVDDGTGYKGANKKRIDDYISKAKAKGYIPYVAMYDRELDEINLGEWTKLY